ncbi:hypothetical protein J4470_00300 [Candidatus Woesearchaeota archaeon]|nr:hypothetical protein [Candidatus Woesearchaeota archaeon]
MNERRINKHKYAAVFAITTLIFILGIAAGNYYSGKKLSELSELSQAIQLDTLGAELQFLLIAYEPCRLFNVTTLGNELYSIGSKVDFMESELGSDNKELLGLKAYYNLLELRHWLLLKQAGGQCNQKFDRILYFYSNKGDCDRCEDEGGVLTYLRRKHPTLSIYSFDINIDNPALLTIKQLYNVGGELPVLVINDKTYNGFMDSKEIEEGLSISTLQQRAVPEGITSPSFQQKQAQSFSLLPLRTAFLRKA